MEKKIIGMFVCTLLITTCVLPVGGNIVSRSDYSVNSTIFHSMTKQEIYKEIEETDDKTLVVDNIIGDVHVKYWEHKINGIIVKNDYVLLHLSVGDEKILKYEKTWADLSLQNCPDAPELNDEEYFWKKAVVFPEARDLTYFYSVDKNQGYPVVCWEVRYIDGKTILYDSNGNTIGSGIPAPYDGFSLSGYNDASWPDPWIDYRKNADFWFSQWCDTTTSLSMPSPSTISSYISNANVMYFYELAHGDEFNFQADSIGSSYTATMAQNNMAARLPMEFTFLGNCHGMTTTGSGTFSYAFRKGQMSDTVTVGFTYMETCPGWQYEYYWQDSMFENMSKGVTIKNAFDMATAQYPTIAPAVVFLGDQNLIVPLPPATPNKPSGSTSGKIGTTYSYSTSTTDLNGDKVKYGWDWNGDNIVDQWDDNNGNYYISGTTITTSYTWNEEGTYNIKVKAKDQYGKESGWSEPLSVSMPKTKAKLIYTPFLRFLENYPLIYQLLHLLGRVNK
jgi:hypothetical protein